MSNASKKIKTVKNKKTLNFFEQRNENGMPPTLDKPSKTTLNKNSFTKNNNPKNYYPKNYSKKLALNPQELKLRLFRYRIGKKTTKQ